MSEDIIINPRLDVVIDAVDDVTQTAQLTNGEQIFCLAVLLIGQLREAQRSGGDVRAAITQPLLTALVRGPIAVSLMQAPAVMELAQVCQVEVQP